MSIQKPYNLNIRNTTIDAKLPYMLQWSTSGDTSASFAINIYNNDSGVLTYSLPRTYSFAMSYTLPANFIPNGVDYKISITVWNSTEQSATSDFVVFTASSTPVVTVPAIGTIGNHSYLFSATYSQSENDPLSMYTINLYNANGTLWKTSGVKSDGLLEHRFDLLKNELTYFIEFIVTSRKGLSASSGLISFNVVYENANMYFALSASPMPEKASVKLNWSVKQVIGLTNIAPVYIDGTKLDVRSGKVFYDEGFEIQDDFTLKIWFEQLDKDVDLIYLLGSNGNIRIQYKSDNCFHLTKKVNNFTYHYSTGEIVGNGFFLCIQQKSSRMDMYAEMVPTDLQGTTFSQLNGTTFNQIPNTTFL